MAERIHKLQPDRTLNLRGFDGFGAAAALHSATPNSFRVSGVFRDPADFCVLVLHDADNFFEHPSIRYLPSFDFAGLTLECDLRYTGLMPLDSPKFATIDWPRLDVIPVSGEPFHVDLFPHARQNGGEYTAATGKFTVVDRGLKQYDRVTLWYLNFAFDYLVSDPVECAWAFYAKAPRTVHTVTVGQQAFSYTEKAGDTSAAIARGLADALAASPDVVAAPGDGTPENGPAYQLNFRARRDDGKPVSLSSSAGPEQPTLYGIGPGTVARELAAQINFVKWSANKIDLPIAAEANGAEILLRCTRPGVDGNSVSLYAVSKNKRLTTSEAAVQLTSTLR